MVLISIEDSSAPLTEADIQQVEQEINVRFPDQYRQFILQYNGGRPIPNVFMIPDDRIPGQSSMLDWFYCIDLSDEYNHLLRNLDVFRDRMPSDCVPIGCDPGGNQICLIVSGAQTGKIYFWDHEEEADEGEIPTYRNMYLIAESIDDLLNNKLMEPPE